MRLARFNFVTLALLLILGTLPAFAAGSDGPQDERVLHRDAAGVPTFMAGDLGVLESGIAKRDAAIDFLRGFAGENLRATGDETFASRSVYRDDLGQVHVRVRQSIHGLPVVGAELIVHADRKSNRVIAVNGKFVSADGLATEPKVEAGVAFKQALAEAGIVEPELLSDVELTYVLDGRGESAHLAWKGLVAYENEVGPQKDWVFADATSGALVTRHPTIIHAKSWRTYDANNGSSLPGTLRCTNTQTCSDSVEQAIHDNTSDAYDYYNTKFGRDSFNGSGATITSTAHYGSSYVNAYWNGSQLVYGDGDGSNSGPLGNAFDVVAHELTHAVTDYESNLIYQNESGALNEAFSDIFAAAAEAWLDGGVNSNTWKVGEDTWTPGISGDALRYMDDPTDDGSSYDYYPERYTGSSDNGGVHLNSGIANLAFQLLVDGGTHPRGKTSNTVPGIGMAKAEQIFYRAQTTYLSSSSNFAAARTATANAAADLYGSSSSEVDAVHEAWCAVGVPNCPGSGGGGGGCPSGYTSYTGSISNGQSITVAQGSASGTIDGILTGTATDLDLYLDKESCSWWSCSWSNVDSSLSSNSSEQVTYSGSSGTYRWRVVSYSGSGTYELCTNQP
ncbi:MAG: M4 family metallopeptidase [Acidobacteriota bacterium]|nr:M4 family metallopeptidase [Acidobacteriota bacterium]